VHASTQSDQLRPDIRLLAATRTRRELRPSLLLIVLELCASHSILIMPPPPLQLVRFTALAFCYISPLAARHAACGLDGKCWEVWSMRRKALLCACDDARGAGHHGLGHVAASNEGGLRLRRRRIQRRGRIAGRRHLLAARVCFDCCITRQTRHTRQAI
jgi:hypothetical protein